MLESDLGHRQDYEVALNEEKRQLNLLRNDYIGYFTEEFANLV